MTTINPAPRHVRPEPDALDRLLAASDLSDDDRRAVQQHADRLLAREERKDRRP